MKDWILPIIFFIFASVFVYIFAQDVVDCYAKNGVIVESLSGYSCVERK